MPDRPELPTTFAHGHSVYNVLPDVKPMTWSVWDLDGWIGDIHLDDEWSYTAKAGDSDRPFATWELATAALLDARPDEMV